MAKGWQAWDLNRSGIAAQWNPLQMLSVVRCQGHLSADPLARLQVPLCPRLQNRDMHCPPSRNQGEPWHTTNKCPP